MTVLTSAPAPLHAPAVRSPTAGLEWPAAPSWPGALTLALLDQLVESQWWSISELRALQLRQAAVLFKHARATVPFYRDRLRGVAIDPARPLAWEVYASLPVLTKEDVRAAGPTIFSDTVPRSHGKIETKKTSGSTGMPLDYRVTNRSELIFHICRMRETLWHRRDLTRKTIGIRILPDPKSYPDGMRHETWGSPFQEVFDTGPLIFQDIFLDPDQLMAWLVKEAPGYVTTYPSCLQALLRTSKAMAITLPGLLQARTYGETLYPDLRAECRAVWGVEIADLYGASEVGYLAAQCAEHGSYHLQSEAAIVEVLDEGGQPCRPGETGRIVATQLHNFAMPLIRYFVGDYAEVGEACPCGRGLPTLRRIQGRERNMLTLPSGEKRFGVAPRTAIGKVAAVRRFQVAQTARDAIEIRLVVERPLQPAQEEFIRASVAAQLRHPFVLTLSYRDTLPLSAAGKFEDFTSEIEA